MLKRETSLTSLGGLQGAGRRSFMNSQDLGNILDIVTNLVSGDRTIDQESTEVRGFKDATSKLVARLIQSAPSEGEPKIAPTPFALKPNMTVARPTPVRD